MAIKRSPIKWLGGKSLSAEKIISFFPKHKIYVEPFAGACWILFNKERVDVEVINDINGDLVNFFKVLQSDCDGLINRMNFTLKSRDLYNEYRKTLHDKNLSEMERAFRFYYVNQFAFGGFVRYNKSGECNTPFGCMKDRPNPGSFWDKQKLLDAFERLKDVIIENMDYEKIVKNYDTKDTLFYLDPPYICKSGHYNGENDFDYERLKNVCENIQGKFVLTLDSSLKEYFSDFKIVENNVHYSIGRYSDSNKKYGEIIVTNFQQDSIKSLKE